MYVVLILSIPLGLRVNIYFYLFHFVIGDMGGEIGLMLGASLLTFFEFVDLFAFLGYHQLLRLYKEKKFKRQTMKRKAMIKKQNKFEHQNTFGHQNAFLNPHSENG